MSISDVVNKNRLGPELGSGGQARGPANQKSGAGLKWRCSSHPDNGAKRKTDIANLGVQGAGTVRSELTRGTRRRTGSGHAFKVSGPGNIILVARG